MKLMTREFSKISMSSMKDRNISLLRSTIAESQLVENVEKHKLISAFMTEVSSLQDRSYMKITEKERKAKYLALRAEEEEKRKEDVEKMMKLNK